MRTLLFRSVTSLFFCARFLAAQHVDDTKLKLVIIFGRHSVRAPVAPNSYLNSYSVRPYPVFSVGPGILTENGARLSTILGSYYRLWLTKEGLLTGNDLADAPFVYFRANVLQRTRATAQAIATGMLPGAALSIDWQQQGSDPLFDPVGAGVARFDQRKAMAAVNGRLGGNSQSLTSAYASELALTRSVLFGYPASQTPVPATPAGTVDVTTLPMDVTAGTPALPVNIGGLITVVNTIDPFVMEYADGLPASDVGWGQLTVGGVGETSRFITLAWDLLFRTPYLAGVQSSNLASHIVRSMLQSATGNSMTGALGYPSSKVVMLVASDVNVTGLAGLFHLDWMLPGYQANFCSPGGALVFQLRQSQSTGEYIVRASYIAQTLDQLRNRTVLTLNTPPASAPVFIPGCSSHNATFDCALADFVSVAKRAIELGFADRVN
jgi:4-phytase / acid phosphatase